LRAPSHSGFTGFCKREEKEDNLESTLFNFLFNWLAKRQFRFQHFRMSQRTNPDKLPRSALRRKAAVVGEIATKKIFVTTFASCLSISGALIVSHSLLNERVSSEGGVLQRSAHTLVELRRAEDVGRVRVAGTQQPRQLADTLSHSAETHKAQIIALTLDPESRTGGQSADVLDVKGSYPAIKALLADISNAHNGVAIRQVTLRRANQFSDIEGRVTFIVKTDPRP
jgi:hypothetical protein